MNAQISVPNHRTTFCIAEQTKNLNTAAKRRGVKLGGDRGARLTAKARAAGKPKNV
jgi:hypothetical protein